LASGMWASGVAMVARWLYCVISVASSYFDCPAA
jgi:hypothetical protein